MGGEAFAVNGISPSIGTLAAFVLALGILIVFHEWGHYAAARSLGVKVLRFSIGLGPVVMRRRWGKDQTEWVVSLIPLGGYVRMLDEREGPVAPEEQSRAFNRQSLATRSLIVFAGPLANLVLTWLLFSFLYGIGLPGQRACFGQPQPETPAARAGVQAGECWVSEEGSPQSWQQLELRVAGHANTLTMWVQGIQGQRHERQLKAPPSLHGNAGVASWGLQPWNPPLAPVVGQVVSGSAAARAGLQVGDRIVAVGSLEITQWAQLVKSIESRAEQITPLRVRRNAQFLNLTVVPQAVTLSSQKTVGRIGIAPLISEQQRQQWTIIQRDAPLQALWHGATQTCRLGWLSLVSLGEMVSGQGSWDDLGGPVRIASLAGQSARLGVIPYLEFLAMISLSLGILNLLPIPILDGGHLLYHALEYLMGRPLSASVMARAQRMGLLLLLGMMGLSFYNDLRHFFN